MVKSLCCSVLRVLQAPSQHCQESSVPAVDKPRLPLSLCPLIGLPLPILPVLFRLRRGSMQSNAVASGSVPHTSGVPVTSTTAVPIGPTGFAVVDSGDTATQ